ncbi:MAG TPA: CBS domain-containing protein [Gemmatimonadaceae bacterium]
MAQDRDRDRRTTRKAQLADASSGRGESAAESTSFRESGVAGATGRESTSASARPTDDVSWSGARGGAREPRQGETTDVPSYGHFYSRARNRFSQWEGRGGYGGSWAPRGWSRSGYGAGFGGSGYSTPGYGMGWADREYREYRGMEGEGRDVGDRRFSQHRDYGDIPGERGYYTSGAAGGALADRGYGMASREERRGRWQREPLRAGEIMTRNPKSATRDTSIRDVARIMKDENTGIVPVVDAQGRLQGVVTDRDIVMRSIPEGKDPAVLRAADLMTDDVEAVTPDDSVLNVVRTMGDKQVRRVPVVDQEDHLVGIISMADVATRADFDMDLQDALEEISSKRSFWSKLFG